MNVLLLTDKLMFGGAETYFCKLENRLEHAGMEFYYAAGVGELVQSIKKKDHFIPLSRKNHIKNLKKLKKVIEEKDIRLIHANSLRMVLYSSMLKRLVKRDLDVIYTKHNITDLERFVPKLFSFLINREVSRIITVSEYERRNLIRLGIKAEKIRTIYNGVDLTQFVFANKEENAQFNIGILARLSEEKNHELFIRIAEQWREHPNVHFHIAGDGPEAGKINRLIDRLGLQSSVHMRGMVSDPEQFIREMDVLLLTSNREIFPMVILEAMAVGTPVISIDRGGISEAIVENETGFLIADHLVDDFKEKLLVIFESDASERERLRAAARRRAEKDFSLDKMIKETLDEYIGYQ
ncbi:glycosyltransferase [Halobacillus fulvus]|nr:glycosyltransferase [Halobacillus fulvus]